jgi:hypothetical protein
MHRGRALELCLFPVAILVEGQLLPHRLTGNCRDLAYDHVLAQHGGEVDAVPARNFNDAEIAIARDLGNVVEWAPENVQ